MDKTKKEQIWTTKQEDRKKKDKTIKEEKEERQ